MRPITLSAIITAFCLQGPVQALGTYQPIEPSGTLQSARKHKLLLATVRVSPNEFSYNGKLFSFKQAWIQRTKHGKRVLLCFTLSGFKKKHRFIGFEADDLQFDALGQYFGLDAKGLDGHWVHNIDITSFEKDLPATVQVAFYGSLKDTGHKLNSAPVLERFVFEIQKVAASK